MTCIRGAKRTTRIGPLVAAFAMSLLAATAQVGAEVVEATASQVAASAGTSEFTLDNGVRVVVVPDHRVPVVTHMVWYAVGAAEEAANEHGVAHYLEHMMFKGTSAYPKGAFDRFVTRRGGAHNATTSMDNTVYFQRLPKSALPQIMAMEADRMANLHIVDADVASERAVVLEEYRRGELSISMGLNKQVIAAIYGSDPRSRLTIGTEAEIKALDGPTAQHFYERFYDPARAMVVIAGDVTEAEARELTMATYGKVARRGVLAPRAAGSMPMSGPNQRFEASHERATAVQVTRTYVLPAGEITSRRDASAGNLFGFIAGGGLTSRMHRRLVNEAGIATQASCSFSVGKQAAMLECAVAGRAGVPAPQLEEAFAAVLRELGQDGVNDEEFDEIKSRYLATAAYRKDNVYSRADTYGSLLSQGWSIAEIDAMDDNVASLSRSDVERIGKLVLNNGRCITGVLTPPPAAGATTAKASAN